MSRLDELQGLGPADYAEDACCPHCDSKSYDLTEQTCDDCNWSLPKIHVNRISHRNFPDTWECAHCGACLGQNKDRCWDCFIERGLHTHDSKDTNAQIAFSD